MQPNLIWKTQQALLHCSLLKKVELLNLKSNVDKLNIDKVKTTPVDSSKLSNIINNDVVKNNGYNKYEND